MSSRKVNVREHPCPLGHKCSFVGKTEDGLCKHWRALHERAHGNFKDFCASKEVRHGVGSSSVAGGSSSSSSTQPDMASEALAHLNEMTYRYGQTEAEKGRAKQLASACLQTMKSHIVNSLTPHVHATTSRCRKLSTP